MPTWPTQAECDAFYGNPRGPNGKPSAAWVKANLTTIPAPYRMTFDGRPVTRIQIHRKCADSLSRVLAGIWTASGHNQARIEEWGADKFGGTFNYRLMRGLDRLSMHSYGCAIDIDPARNGLGNPRGHLLDCPLVVAAFLAEGWVWGGHWQTRPDAMHFQAARIS
jgi:hypothetical protein